MSLLHQHTLTGPVLKPVAFMTRINAFLQLILLDIEPVLDPPAFSPKHLESLLSIADNVLRRMQLNWCQLEKHNSTPAPGQSLKPTLKSFLIS
jgi:hypothetical protein